MHFVYAVGMLRKRLIAILNLKQFQNGQSIHKHYFACKSVCFVNDEVRTGCPKSGHTTLTTETEGYRRLTSAVHGSFRRFRF